MKVAQINSVCDCGSTGRLCADISEALNNNNIENRIFYGIGKSKLSNAIKISSDLYVKINILKTRIFGSHAFYSHIATLRLIRYLDQFRPTIVHLHQIHGHYLNIELLISYLKRKKIPLIITLHDCWLLTGHCTHFSKVKCDKWKKGCGNCPQTREYPVSLLFDKSASNWRRKKRVFDSLDNVTFVCVSTWLEKLAQESYLRGKDILTVYNGIDTNIFSSDNIKRDNKKFVILGMAGKWLEKENEEASTYLINAAENEEDIEIWLIGTNKKFQSTCVKTIEYISSQEEIAKYYSRADVFVNLSHEDSFGLVSAEALACGTPVVCYNATALPEIVGENGECGYYVEDFNYVDIWKKIIQIKEKGKDSYSLKCRKRVMNNFDKDKMCNKIIELYQAKEK